MKFIMLIRTCAMVTSFWRPEKLCNMFLHPYRYCIMRDILLCCIFGFFFLFSFYLIYFWWSDFASFIHNCSWVWVIDYRPPCGWIPPPPPPPPPPLLGVAQLHSSRPQSRTFIPQAIRTILAFYHWTPMLKLEVVDQFAPVYLFTPTPKFKNWGWVWTGTWAWIGPPPLLVYDGATPQRRQSTFVTYTSDRHYSHLCTVTNIHKI